VARLLDAASRRPVAELGRQPVALPGDDPREGGQPSWTYEALSADNFERCHAAGRERLADQARRRDRLERLGRERVLFYLLAVSTGLRWRELASLTVGQVHLDALPSPFLVLEAQDAKSGRSANVPLRSDVAEALRQHLAERGNPTFTELLFATPPTIRVFDADCQAAGIAKRDDRGRIVDIHALRHTFGTHLSACGVHPRTKMAAMRQGRIELTMNYYTDPTLLDVAGAVNALPAFGATGTDAGR
jgi:integrase